MYRTRRALPHDTLALVPLLWEAMYEANPNKVRTTKLAYEFAVTRWIQSADVIVVLKDNIVVGFVVASEATFDNLVQPYYHVDLIYVSKAHRKTKAAYLLYHWVVAHAKEANLQLEIVATTEISKRHAEKFGGEVTGYFMETKGNK